MPAEHPLADLLPAYALRLLDKDEAQYLEAHLESCEICRDELQGYQLVVDQLSLAVSEVEPPSELKQRLMAGIERETGTAVPSPHPSFLAQMRKVMQKIHMQPLSRRAALVVMALLLVANLLLWLQVNQLRAPETGSGMIAISLTSTDAAPGATGFLLVSEDGLSGAIVADELPQLEDDLQYQLWLFRGDDEPIAAAFFTVDALGYGGKWVDAPDSIHTYTHFSVTVEPVEGRDKPSGEIVLTGILP